MEQMNMEQTKSKKLHLPAELIYIIGIVVMSLGNGIMACADLGVSMVVAPAKVLSDKTGISFGWSGVIVEAVLLIAMCMILRKFRIGYLFSFVTTVVYGLVLNLHLSYLTYLPMGNIWLRLLWTAVGMAVTSFGVACFFHTYLAPEVYDLFVREVSERFSLPISRFKTLYDCSSLLVAIVMTLILFGGSTFAAWSQGNFSGIGPATLICAFVNGWMIGTFSKWLGRIGEFRPLLPLEKYFK